MTVLRNDDRWDRSNVVFRDGRLLRYDKKTRMADMTHIDYGVALLRSATLDLIPPDQPFDLADLYRALVSEGSMAGHEVTQRFYEVGSPDGLAETCAHLEKETATMSYTASYLSDAARIAERLDVGAIDRMVQLLADLRARGGRLFVLGVGGSAGNASHAVNDFRKICGIEAYTPTDNASELTARINDEGWDTTFVNWLRVSHLSRTDAILILSVGGGDLERNISPNLVRALDYSRELGTPICGIVGRDGGHAARTADVCVVVPTVNPETVTPHAEAFQAVVWHLIVSHPKLKASEMKWESAR
jgi:D-sedoheptulose 7-phosphate isomerase